MSQLSAIAPVCDDLFTRAVESVSGIIVATNSTERAQSMLTRYRKELGNPDYAKIGIRLSPDDPDRELWLIKIDDDAGADADADASANVGANASSQVQL